MNLHGCMDIPANGAQLSRSATTIVAGWCLSILTRQQPVDVQVYANGVGMLTPSQYRIDWRVYRPDVAKAYGVESPYLGYTIHIAAGVLPVGPVTLAVNFLDPASGTGMNSQQVNVTVQ